MFVTILFGDNKMEMFNLNCKLVSFIRHLKEKCGLDLNENVELMDSRGRVMNVEAKQQSLALTSSVLEERQNYVLLRVSRDEDTGVGKYVSLLNTSSQDHPELTELLKKVSNLNKERERRIRGRTQRSRNVPANAAKQKKSFLFN